MTIPTKYLIFFICLATPFLLWIALYAMSRRVPQKMSPVVVFVRMLRWVSSVTTVVAFLLYLSVKSFPRPTPWCAFAFSSGIVLVDLWISERFAPVSKP
jgi:ABC-type maltose transport system permease subunit